MTYDVCMSLLSCCYGYDVGSCSADCVDDLCFIWSFDDDECGYDHVGVVFDFSFSWDFPHDVRDKKIASNTIHVNWIMDSKEIESE